MSETEPMTLDHLLGTAVDALWSDPDQSRSAAVERAKALLTPAARLALAAEFLHGIAAECSISGDVHTKTRADFDALVESFGAKPGAAPLSSNGLHISHTARLGGWVTIYYCEVATAEALAALFLTKAEGSR